MCVQLYSFTGWIFITTDFIDLEHRLEKLLGNAVNAASRSSNVETAAVLPSCWNQFLSFEQEKSRFVVLCLFFSDTG
jgi:hypothetical protein